MRTRTHVKNALMAALLVAGVQFLDACQPKSGGGTPAAPAPTSPGTPSPNSSDGPGHTGGGNGIDYKVYDAYIVDPTQLPAFAKIQPISARITAAFSSSKNSDPQAELWKFKTWYLIPQSLPPIDNSTFGILSKSSDQYALQTDVAVMIDSQLYNKMSPDDQSELLLHEYVMNIYLLKYVTLKQLCAKLSDSKNPCSTWNDEFEQAFEDMVPVQDPKPLTPDDYDNIRSVTNQLMLHGSDMTAEEMSNLFINHNFDQRFFQRGNNGTKGTDQPTLKISAVQLAILLSKAQLAHALPSTCQSMLLNRDVPCRVEFTDDNFDFGGQKVLAKKLVIRNTDDQSILGRTVFEKTSSLEVGVEVSQGSQPVVIGTIIPDSELFYNPKAGAVGYYAVVTFALPPRGALLKDMKWTDLSILSVSTFPIADVGSGDQTTNGQGQTCTEIITTALNPQKPAEDVIADGDGKFAKFERIAVGQISHFNSCR